MNYLLYLEINIHEMYFIKTLQKIIEKKLIKEINVNNLSKENNNELYIYNFTYENDNMNNNIGINFEKEVDIYIKNILIIIEKYIKIYFHEFNNKWKINYNLIKQ